VAADPDLYAFADRKTTAIAEEHPEWDPAQVMLEAGKQTREWVAKLSGKTAPTTSSAVADIAKRQQLKQKLTPMPQARSARPAPLEDPNADDSPADYMAAIRKARGQAF